MKKLLTLLLVMILSISSLAGCSGKEKNVKIGVSFGVGAAARWEQEIKYMEDYANELGVEIETRLNKTDEPLTQAQDCKELIDNGATVLIITARDVYNMKEIIDYAKSKEVPIISYARLIMNDPYDLYVGYDSNRIGQKMGQYLSETVIEGDYIILSGDPKDVNATQTYEGALRYIDPIRNNINVILESAVEGWSVDVAKEMVKKAIIENDNKIDAIFAPNDKLAGGAREVIEELGITNPVHITGMDAELDAIKRIVNDKQDMTIFMDLKILSRKAIDESIKLSKKEEADINTAVETDSEVLQNAHLITGQTITKENIDKHLIETGVFTKEEVYSE